MAVVERAADEHMEGGGRREEGKEEEEGSVQCSGTVAGCRFGRQ